MGPKRDFSCAIGGQNESLTRSGGSKRLCCCRHDQGWALQEFTEKPNPSDLQLVEDKSREYGLNVPHLSSRTHIYRLQFRNNLQNVLFTDKTLKAENDMQVEIAIVDASNMVITSGPAAKAEIEIVVLDGDFHGDDNGECTTEEFNKHVIDARKDKRPLLLGKLFIKLCDGFGYITDAKFTDNSSWTKSKNFRLGVRLHQGEGMAGNVQEGISNAFRVKDRHGEKNQKDHPPAMSDDVCCLKGISKNGPYKKKLADLNISTVGDFLSYCRDNSPEKVCTMIGMTERAWKKTYCHAIESEMWSVIPLNSPVNLPAPDQNYSQDAGSNSSKFCNIYVQPDGIVYSGSFVNCKLSPVVMTEGGLGEGEVARVRDERVLLSGQGKAPLVVEAPVERLSETACDEGPCGAQGEFDSADVPCFNFDPFMSKTHDLAYRFDPVILNEDLQSQLDNLVPLQLPFTAMSADAASLQADGIVYSRSFVNCKPSPAVKTKGGPGKGEVARVRDERVLSSSRGKAPLVVAAPVEIERLYEKAFDEGPSRAQGEFDSTDIPCFNFDPFMPKPQDLAYRLGPAILNEDLQSQLSQLPFAAMSAHAASGQVIFNLCRSFVEQSHQLCSLQKELDEVKGEKQRFEDALRSSEAIAEISKERATSAEADLESFKTSFFGNQQPHKAPVNLLVPEVSGYHQQILSVNQICLLSSHGV